MQLSYFRAILLLGTITLVAACTRPPELIGIDNRETPVATSPATKHKIYIATSREATEAAGVFYSGDRGTGLALASVVVSIPPNHVAGEIERPRKLPPDPATEFAVVDPTVYGTSGVFKAEINRALAAKAPKDREVLLFVHGYNNTMTDSVLRMAQFVEDTGFTGVPVLFSWASAARTTHYVYDMNSALIARPLVLETSRILGQTNARGFSIFAHSMGSLLTIEAMVHSDMQGFRAAGGRLDNVMLASPDIDLDLFTSQLAQMKRKNKNFFVFVSKDDKALGFSRRISGGIERVGNADTEHLANLGVTVIDLSEVDDSASGTHSKFAGSPEVVQLIGQSLKTNNLSAHPRPPSMVELLNGVPVVLMLPE